MNNILKLLPLAAVITVLLAGAVSCKNTEKAEEEAADIEAAQIMGRNAAREFINKEWKDTLELQHHLLYAKSQQSKYLIEGKEKAAAAFDSAFISTIRTVNPKLASEIKQ